MYANITCDAMSDTDAGLNTIHLIHAYGLTNIMQQNFQELYFWMSFTRYDGGCFLVYLIWKYLGDGILGMHV